MLHVGNARTALFDWLYARRHNGLTLLRIEDTDDSRNHPEWVDLIYRSLEWLGLDWDGDPTFQSASFDEHRDTALRLFDQGAAYYCDCTAEDLAARKEAAGEKTPGYDSFCADRALPAGEGRALRFRVPAEGALTRVDVIRGTTEIDLSTVEDFVILRSNGIPLYVFANCLDDIRDGITHVLRGEDHLANVAKQMLIRRALGADDPVWAHLPMIVNERRKKLSKRRDKVALATYQDEGYLSEAMANYLATLGWMPPAELGEELATLDAMIGAFDLADVNSAPAAFDVKKLDAFNGFYLRRLDPAEFVERARPFFDHDVLEQMAEPVQTRLERLSQLPEMLDFLVDDVGIDPDAWDRAIGSNAEVAAAILDDAATTYAGVDPFEAAALHEATTELAGRAGLTLGKAQAPIRVAVSGRTVGPPLFESMAVLGRDETLARLRAARGRIT